MVKYDGDIVTDVPTNNGGKSGGGILTKRNVVIGAGLFGAGYLATRKKNKGGN